MRVLLRSVKVKDDVHFAFFYIVVHQWIVEIFCDGRGQTAILLFLFLVKCYGNPMLKTLVWINTFES